VVAVKEGQGLLLQDQEDSIEEFIIFGHVIEEIQNNQWLGPAASAADTIVQTTVPDSGDELLGEKDEQSRAECGQDEVVDHEQAIELVGWAVLHDLTTTEDEYIVPHNGDHGCLEGQHRSDALDELELFWVVAGDTGPDFVEC